MAEIRPFRVEAFFEDKIAGRRVDKVLREFEERLNRAGLGEGTGPVGITEEQLRTALAGLVTTEQLNAALAPKADTNAVNTMLDGKADKSEILRLDAKFGEFPTFRDLRENAVGIFIQSFDDPVHTVWTSELTNQGAISYPRQGQTGGRVFQTVDRSSFTFPRDIPYLTNQLYAVRCRVRRIAAPVPRSDESRHDIGAGHFYTGGTITVEPSNASRPELTGSTIVGSNRRWLGRIRIWSNGQVELNVTGSRNENLGTSNRDDLADAWEERGGFDLSVVVPGQPDDTISVAIGDADSSEPYRWTPSNSADVIAWYNRNISKPNTATSTRATIWTLEEDTSEDAEVYVGLKAYDDDGAEIPPSTGSGIEHEAHWYCAKGETLDEEDEWYEFTGYVKGLRGAATAAAPEPSVNARRPSPMVEGTVAFRPTFDLGNDGNATMQLDFLEVHKIEESPDVAVIVNNALKAQEVGDGQIFDLANAPVNSSFFGTIGTDPIYSGHLGGVYIEYRLETLLDANLLPSGATNAYIATFTLTVVRLTGGGEGASLEIRTVTRATENVGFDTAHLAGPDLSSAWEIKQDAIVLGRPDGSTITLPGPAHSSNQYQDASEPYTWRPSAAKETELLTFYGVGTESARTSPGASTMSLIFP